MTPYVRLGIVSLQRHFTRYDSDLGELMSTPALPRPLWTLVTSFGLGNLADGVVALAIPLLASSLTSSPAQIAAATALLTLPLLICALPLGMLLDRQDRRVLALLAHTTRTGILLGLLLLAGAEQLTLLSLYVAAFLLGTATTLANSAAPTLVNHVVPKPLLEQAGARVTGVQTLATEFAGPALGGLLITLGQPVTLLAGTLLNLSAVLTLVRLRGVYRAATPLKSPLLKELHEGVRFLMHHDLLRTLVFMTAGMNICWSVWLALAPVRFGPHSEVGLSASLYGFVVAGLGIGGLAGALCVNGLTRRLGRRLTIALDLLGTLALISTPAFTTQPTLIFLSALAGGFGGTLWAVLVGALRQRLVPDALLGRVSSAWLMISWGVIPLSAALAGWLAEKQGVESVYWAGGLLALLLFIPFFRTLNEARLASGPG